MRFVHSREYLSEGDVVVVSCSHQCNIKLMQDSDFSAYQRAGGHHYHGGHFKRLPARIAVPSSGYWNITIDLGGSPSAFKYGIRCLRQDAA